MIYTYKCSNCNNEFLIKKDMKESSSKELCPDCGKELKRVWSTSYKLPEYDPVLAEVSSKLRHSRPTGRSKVLF